MERSDDDRNAELQERSEPDQPPVDGPSAGSPGQAEDDKDLGDTSYGAPGGTG